MKPILCLDFDGVIHSYTSGWQGADVVGDPPVPGAMEFMGNARLRFQVMVYSSRSHQPGGIEAMRAALKRWATEYLQEGYGWLDDTEFEEGRERAIERTVSEFLSDVKFPTEKPAALVTLDDRAITFDGTWPDFETLQAFKPWNKQ